MKIITNHHKRELLYFWQFDKKDQEYIREYHDWIESSDTLTWNDAMFFKYKDHIYCLEDFMRIDHHPNSDFMAWDGYSSDSFFSGIVIKFIDEPYYEDCIIVGWYMS